MNEKIIFQGHYNSWYRNRKETLLKILLHNTFFTGKSIIDMGSGIGIFAQMLYEVGAKVTCSDIRQEYLHIVNRKYPHINTKVHDYEVPFNDTTLGFYDMICHFGVLNHIKNFEEHLRSVEGKSAFLFLDCEVLDSTDANLKIEINENGYDQSVYGVGSVCTAEYVERILSEMNMTFVRITLKSLNTNAHRYNWEVQNSGLHHLGYRRLWICAQKGYKLSNCINNISQYIRGYIVNDKPTYDFGTIDFNEDKLSIIVTPSLVDDVKIRLMNNDYVIYGVYKCYENSELVNIMAAKTSIRASEKFSFVLQGLDKGVITDTLRNKVFKYGIPIDAIWKSEDLAVVKSDILKNKYHNSQNVYYQIYSTYEGLKNVTTPYVFKIRADEYYSDFDIICKKLIDSPDIIISNNIFARRIEKYPFHISDHLIAGSSDNMKKMFERGLQNLQNRNIMGVCAEQHITCSYICAREGLSGFKELPKQYERVKELMIKYFFIISVKQLGDFFVRANSIHRFALKAGYNDHEYKRFVDIESIDEI